MIKINCWGNVKMRGQLGYFFHCNRFRYQKNVGGKSQAQTWSGLVCSVKKMIIFDSSKKNLIYFAIAKNFNNSGLPQ